MPSIRPRHLTGKRPDTHLIRLNPARQVRACTRESKALQARPPIPSWAPRRFAVKLLTFGVPDECAQVLLSKLVALQILTRQVDRPSWPCSAVV